MGTHVPDHYRRNLDDRHEFVQRRLDEDPNAPRADSRTLHFPSDGVSIPVGPGGVFNVIGWVDLHHPCEGHIKARFRVLLPARYHGWEQMKELVERMFSALGIPADETYEASFVSADQQTGIEQATDRHGMTDRLY